MKSQQATTFVMMYGPDGKTLVERKLTVADQRFARSVFNDREPGNAVRTRNTEQDLSQGELFDVFSDRSSVASLTIRAAFWLSSR
jgi:hypothetical protein